MPKEALMPLPPEDELKALTDYPLTLTAINKQDKIQWEIGDALIQETSVGPTGPNKANNGSLAELVKVSVQIKIHLGIDIPPETLRQYRSVASAFHKHGDRSPCVPWTVHMQLGTPEKLQNFLLWVKENNKRRPTRTEAINFNREEVIKAKKEVAKIALATAATKSLEVKILTLDPIKEKTEVLNTKAEIINIKKEILSQPPTPPSPKLSSKPTLSLRLEWENDFEQSAKNLDKFIEILSNHVEDLSPIDKEILLQKILLFDQKLLTVKNLLKTSTAPALTLVKN